MVLGGNNLLDNPPEIISDIPREYNDATLITADNQASNAENTVYTVPAGKKLMLMSLVIDVNFAAGTTGNAGRAKIAGTAVIRLYGAAAAGSKIQSLSTQNTLVLKAAETITVSTQSINVSATVCISGYLLNAGD